MADNIYYIPLLFGASTTLSLLPPLELNMTMCSEIRFPNSESDSPRFPSATLLVLHCLPFKWGIVWNCWEYGQSHQKREGRLLNFLFWRINQLLPHREQPHWTEDKKESLHPTPRNSGILKYEHLAYLPQSSSPKCVSCVLFIYFLISLNILEAPWSWSCA